MIQEDDFRSFITIYPNTLLWYSLLLSSWLIRSRIQRMEVLPKNTINFILSVHRPCEQLHRNRLLYWILNDIAMNREDRGCRVCVMNYDSHVRWIVVLNDRFFISCSKQDYERVQLQQINHLLHHTTVVWWEIGRSSWYCYTLQSSLSILV